MSQRIKVWDLPTRLFHWSSVSAVFYAWFSVEILEDMQQHFYAGYAVLTLLLFRLIWGVVGSQYARFSSFLFSPKELVRYSQSLFKPSTDYHSLHLGHNPVGGLSVIAMLSVLSVQVSLGLFSTDDYFFGPLAGLVSDSTMATLTEWHLLNVNVIYAFLGLHVLAIIYYQFAKQQSLTKAMVTGYKTNANKVSDAITDGTPQSKETRIASNWLALLILIVCAAFVYWLSNAYLDLLPSADELYY